MSSESSSGKLDPKNSRRCNNQVAPRTCFIHTKAENVYRRHYSRFIDPLWDQDGDELGPDRRTGKGGLVEQEGVLWLEMASKELW